MASTKEFGPLQCWYVCALQVASAAIRSSSALLIFWFMVACTAWEHSMSSAAGLSGTIQVLPFCPKFTIFEDPSAKQFVENV